jgi:carboxypeptidase Q
MGEDRKKGPLVSCRALLMVTAALLMAVTINSAQSPDDLDINAITRIKQEAQRSQLVETIGYLTDVYGPRLTGSPHLRAAADYIVPRLTAWGLQNVKFERWGPFGPGWTNDRFSAFALAPQAYPLIAYPKPWTPGTTGDLVAEAVLAPIDNESEFQRFRGKLAGKFVLIARPAELSIRANKPWRYSADDLRKLAAPAPFASPEAESAANLEFARKRMEFYIREDAAVLLEPGTGSHGTVLVDDGRLRDDAAFTGAGFYPWPDAVAAQVVVAAEQYNRIARTLDRGVPVTLEMNIANAYHYVDPDSFNIIAEIPGSDPPSQVVMLGAHFDSRSAGTGAADNAAGSAVVLEAMRILKATGLTMRRTVRVALWTGSEQGLLGSRAYVTHHFADPGTMLPKPEHQGMSAYFNVDGGSGAIRGLYLHGNEAARPVLERWMAPFKESGMTTLSPQAAERSDQFAFNAVGLPGLHFIQDPLDEEARRTNMDVFERLETSSLIQNAIIVAAFVYHAANREEPLPRKPLPAPDTRWAFPQLPRR